MIYSLNLFQHCKWVLLRNAHCSSAWECFYAMDTSKSPQMEFVGRKTTCLVLGVTPDTLLRPLWEITRSHTRHEYVARSVAIAGQKVSRKWSACVSFGLLSSDSFSYFWEKLSLQTVHWSLVSKVTNRASLLMKQLKMTYADCLHDIRYGKN